MTRIAYHNGLTTDIGYDRYGISTTQTMVPPRWMGPVL